MKPRLLTLDERDPLPAPGRFDREPLPVTRSQARLPLPDSAWDELWGEQEIPVFEVEAEPLRVVGEEG
jgi:hypothetical protein